MKERIEELILSYKEAMRGHYIILKQLKSEIVPDEDDIKAYTRKIDACDGALEVLSFLLDEINEIEGAKG